MGSGDKKSAAKHSKPTLTQEAHPPSYADWSSSMQAYHGVGATPPFFSSTPHPYMWGGQHPMMPPYGTQIPYPGLYSPPGVYTHPGMPMTPSITPSFAEMEPKPRDGRKKPLNKKSKSTLGNANGVGVRGGDFGKTASSSGNDGTTTQSAESENDGSTDANAPNDFSGNPSVYMPASNLNTVIDLWNPSAGSLVLETQPNPSSASQIMVPTPMMPDQWAQDERELKRQRRKQSNRESARKSRLRKQAECEELHASVQVLSDENNSLKDELQRLLEGCKKLKSENNSIKDKLSNSSEPIAESKLDGHLQSWADEDIN
uniref:G-box-binding factor 1-like isoform X2 n=1 Tax=Erigeron canadensis TaxID=72917 RepID=UPI001CB95162|nr:G-box-binding factor 1-like isoform X2 [Erigeron canadensis]